MENLFNIKERLGTPSWRSLLEGRRRLLGLLMKSQLCVFGKVTKQNSLAAVAMSRKAIHLYKKNGPLFLGQYLKHVSLLLMWYRGGDLRQRPADIKVYVSLNRSGLPRFIPPHFRKIIRRGEGDLIIKFILTFCSLSKLLKVWPSGQRIKPDTIYVDNYKPTEDCQGFAEIFYNFGKTMVDVYTKGRVKEIPLNLGFRFKPVWSSGPNTWLNPLKDSVESFGSQMKKFCIWNTIPLDSHAIISLFAHWFIEDIGGLWFTTRTFFVDDEVEELVPEDNRGREQFALFLHRLRRPVDRLFVPKIRTRVENGRFGCKLEGAGKVRVFAICNPILQALLRPLHDWVMSVLRILPTDGTFNQLKPLGRLVNKRELFSFDLKAATDSLPVVLSEHLLGSLFGAEFAVSWRKILTYTAFRVPSRKLDRASVYRWTIGQPLGYYSSWPVFALTHHMIVWTAASVVYPGERFLDYAILGDDLVIGDPKVAEEYLIIMDKCKVTISKEKSLVSSNGAMEFAKKFIVGGKDLSPVSLRLLSLFQGFVSAFQFKELNCSLQNSYRLKGAGYRVYSNAGVPKGRRWLRHWLLAHSPSGIHPYPFDLWLTLPEQGSIDIGRLGVVRFFIISQIKPKDFNEKEIDVIRSSYNGDDDMFEGLFSEWMRDHLSYLLWYSKVYLDYSIPLSSLLKPPVICHSTRRNVKDRDLFIKYGLIFKSWELYRSCVSPKFIDCEVYVPDPNTIYLGEFTSLRYDEEPVIYL